MRSIYIRHADKSYGNINDMQYFKHDPGITEIGVQRTKTIAKKLIETYGEPTQIVSSPYRRTRETALIMNSVLKSPLEEISIDIGIAEYLGNHSNIALDVTTATSIHSPPHPENFEQMKIRVKKHIDKLKKYSRKNKKEVIWFITHGLIIKQIASTFNIKTSKQLPYLTSFSFVEEDNVLRAEFVLFRDIVLNKSPSHEKLVMVEPEKPKKIDRFLITPKSEYTGRDDMSGRKSRYI